MNNEIPGAHVPDDIMKRMRATRTKKEARNEGIRIARETLQELKPYIAGVQVSMPFGKINAPLEVLQDVL